MRRLLVTIQCSREDMPLVQDAVDRALTAAGFPPVRPDLHLVPREKATA